MNNALNCDAHLNGVVACSSMDRSGRGVSSAAACGALRPSPIQMHFNCIEGTATDPNRFKPAGVKVVVLQ